MKVADVTIEQLNGVAETLFENVAHARQGGREDAELGERLEQTEFSIPIQLTGELGGNLSKLMALGIRIGLALAAKAEEGK